MRTFKPAREMFIPKGSIKVSDKLSDAVAYLYERHGSAGAVTFVGKQQRPFTHYTYRNAERRDAAVGIVFQNRRKSLAFKAEQQAKRKGFVHAYKVGDGLPQTRISPSKAA